MHRFKPYNREAVALALENDFLDMKRDMGLTTAVELVWKPRYDVNVPNINAPMVVAISESGGLEIRMARAWFTKDASVIGRPGRGATLLTWRAWLAHELAHLAAGHIMGSVSWEQEYEADEDAARVVAGGAYAMVAALMRTARDHTESETHPSTPDRVKRLRENANRADTEKIDRYLRRVPFKCPPPDVQKSCNQK